MSEGRKGKYNHNFGRHLPEDYRRKISESRKGQLRGEKNPAWKGGISFEPYCPRFNKEFKDRVRAFFGYECNLCGKSQRENRKALSVHHVNYQKDACCNEDIPKYFIVLCASCHGYTNQNRKKWEKKLTKKIEKKFDGKCYFHKKEQLSAYGI